MNDPARYPLGHVPVMLSEVLQLLEPRPGDFIVDATIGCGGHAEAIQRRLGRRGRLLGVDRDPEMVERARECLTAQAGSRVDVIVGNFSELDAHLAETGDASADGILLDLGVASPQIDDAERGFSYRNDGPLDMRMARGEEPSAGEWLNDASESELADVFFRYGEERFSRRIARAVVRARRGARIRRTSELADIIRRAVPARRRRLHPARRCFQGIRIFINRELAHLDRFLEILPRILRPGGRCVILSYHSLEDRRVKQAFRDGARSGLYDLLTRKPLRPSSDEVRANPRSRSARLRAVRMISGEARP